MTDSTAPSSPASGSPAAGIPAAGIPAAGVPAAGVPAPGNTRCRTCATELASDALSCLHCGALVHAAELTRLAGVAAQQDEAGALADARITWQEALRLLPAHSRQHDVVTERIRALGQRIDEPAKQSKPADARPWWRHGAGAIVALVLLLAGKLKFLMLGLGKASTLLTMLASFGVYWTAFGWPLALGLVVSIYIHEMGHVAELRRQGVAASAPLFIPGLGAVVLSRMVIEEPYANARVGLAGPVWGLGAGVAAWGIYLATGEPVWAALVQLNGIINLFNLIPVWQLDGARGMNALSRWQRWTLVAAMALAYVATQQPILLLVCAVAVYQAFQPARPATANGVLGVFVLLVLALSLLSVYPVPVNGRIH